MNDEPLLKRSDEPGFNPGIFPINIFKKEVLSESKGTNSAVFSTISTLLQCDR
jgi:hypothetical protein